MNRTIYDATRAADVAATRKSVTFSGADWEKNDIGANDKRN